MVDVILTIIEVEAGIITPAVLFATVGALVVETAISAVACSSHLLDLDESRTLDRLEPSAESAL